MIKTNNHIEDSPVKRDKHKRKVVFITLAIVIALFVSQKVYIFKITSSTMSPTLKS